MEVIEYIKSHAGAVWKGICLIGAIIIVILLISSSNVNAEPMEEVQQESIEVEKPINSFYFNFSEDARSEHREIMQAQAHNRNSGGKLRFRLRNLDGESSKYATFGDEFVDIPLSGWTNGVSNKDHMVEENALTLEERLKEAYDNKCLAIMLDIEALRTGDKETVAKYFGEAFIGMADEVADKVSATTVNFINGEYNSDELMSNVLYVHICTINYPMMQQEYLNLLDNARGSELISTEKEYIELAKNGVAKRLIEGAYNTCYNIPVTVGESGVVVTEELKQIITGNWYQPPLDFKSDLTSVECIID